MKMRGFQVGKSVSENPANSWLAWRRGRDSNSWYPSGHTRFPIVLLRPARTPLRRRGLTIKMKRYWQGLNFIFWILKSFSPHHCKSILCIFFAGRPKCLRTRDFSRGWRDFKVMPRPLNSCLLWLLFILKRG